MPKKLVDALSDVAVHAQVRRLIGSHDVAQAQESIAAGQAGRRRNDRCRRTVNRGETATRNLVGPRTPIQDRLYSRAGNDRYACSFHDGAGQGAFTEPTFDG